jgi:3'-phosphoadenosine 5'-phosphosulfate (PAPS) 3'-phosphatase
VLVRGYHGKQLDVQIKGGDEPVTEADHAASALIVARLREAFPTTSCSRRNCPTRASAWASRASGWSIRSTARAISSAANRDSW